MPHGLQVLAQSPQLGAKLERESVQRKIRVAAKSGAALDRRQATLFATVAPRSKRVMFSNVVVAMSRSACAVKKA